MSYEEKKHRKKTYGIKIDRYETDPNKRFTVIEDPEPLPEPKIDTSYYFLKYLFSDRKLELIREED